MSERFHDDNFIEAAKVYQSIKAPSDLRGRVLADVQAAPQTRSAVKTAAVSGRSRSRSNVYKLASLAACLAVMVVSMPKWLPPESAGEVLAGPDMASTAVVPDKARTAEPDEILPGGADVEPVTAAEPQGQPVYEPESSEPKPDVNPQPEPEQTAVSEPEKEPEREPEREPEADVTPEIDPKRAEADVLTGEPENDPEPAEETPAATASVQLGQLIPTLAAGNEVLGHLEVRLIEGEDGNCTVEVISGEKTGQASVAKSEESGQWEVVEQDS